MFKRRSISAFLLATAAAQVLITPALAADAPAKYAVLSLIGSKLNLVTAQNPTGSNFDRNIKQSVPLTKALFDNQALATIQDLLLTRQPPRDVALYLSSPTALLAPNELFVGKKAALPAALIDGMRADGATHLLLLSRNPQEAMLQMVGSNIGHGRLEGVGFYLDRDTVINAAESQESNRSFLAPYVYLRLSLIELAGGNVLAEQTIRRSTMLSASTSKTSVNPWDALGPAEKIDLLNELLADELKLAVAAVLAGR
ncbi:hypothetical protein BH11PSE10_BH11PSE10_02090 [soil metagenome]